MKNSATYKATDIINGFECRPGIYRLNGASAMLHAISFAAVVPSLQMYPLSSVAVAV